MVVDPNLLVIKPVDQLPQNNAPSEGDHLLSYNEETKELQKTDYGQVMTQISNGFNGVATTSTAPSETGFERYLIHTAGTYTKFKDSGNAAIVVTEDDLDVANGVANNRVIIEVNNGVSKKIVERVKGDAGQNKISQWTAKVYTTGEQVIHNDIWWEAVVNTTSAQEPGVVKETIWKPTIKPVEKVKIQKGVSGVINFNTGNIGGLSLSDHCLIICLTIIDSSLVPENSNLGTFLGRSLRYNGGFINSNLNSGGAINVQRKNSQGVIIANKPVTYSDLSVLWSDLAKDIFTSSGYAYSNTPSINYIGHENIILGDIIVIGRALSNNEVDIAYNNPREFIQDAKLFFPHEAYTENSAFEAVSEKTYFFSNNGTIK